MTEYTKGLCDFITNLKFEHLAPELTDKAKKLTLHVVGAALSGRTLPTAVSARTAARAVVGTQADLMSTMWGESGKVPMHGAVMANATAADTLDWEDCSFTGHPSAHLISVSMAMTEAMHLTGKDYITAVIGGFEIYQRVACYIQPTLDYDTTKYGWGLGSWQIFASAAPAGKLLNCNADQFNLLLGATGCSTPVVNAILALQGSDFYHLQYAITGLTGTMLAGMAKRNELDNIYNIMDGESGYPMMMRGFANEGWIDRNLGTEYLFGQLLLKHWPANMWIQTPLDCLDHLKTEHGFNAEDIEEIFMTPTYEERDKFSWDGYASCRDAQFSVPYCLAAYLLRGEPGANWYRADGLADKELLEMASRVKLDPDRLQTLPEAFKMFTEGSFPTTGMRVTLKDGQQFEVTLPFPKGHPQNPFDWEDVEQTFRSGARAVNLPEDKIQRFIDLCKKIDQLDDMSELAECLSL
ncbi:MmgE/PrpD family protein [Clostridiales bacterium 1_7_47FAA]|nr:MmgE/PrpD family protein [Clostridiales bacterium 1_7_47FAA]